MTRAAAVVLLLCGAAAPAPALALDFGRIVQGLDVNKVVEVGKRLGDSTTEMGVPEEIALGRDLAARLLGAAPLLPDPEVQQYVNRVGRWLTLHTERPELPWHFAVAATDAVGAFATPGGNVIITAGLMRLMQTEDELAGVLAHEVSHVVHRHHVLAIMKKARAELARDLAAELASDLVARNPLITQALLNTGMGLYGSGLDQGDEYAADRNGIVIAARAGYDPLGLIYLLTTLDSLGAAEPRTQLLFATHPPAAERLERLAVLADQMPQASSLKDGSRFAAIQSRLLGRP